VSIFTFDIETKPVTLLFVDHTYLSIYQYAL